MQTDANSFVSRMLDTLAVGLSFFFGGHQRPRGVRPVAVPEPRPQINDIDVRIAINANGFHFVHGVINEKFVFTSTSQRGGLIPIDRTLTPVEMTGNVEQNLREVIQALLDTHADWVKAGRPAQAFDKINLDKIATDLEPKPAVTRRPKKPAPVHTVHSAGEPGNGIPIAEMRDFFLKPPPPLGGKR